MIGVVPLTEGLNRADEAGLDLVEVSPNADPPVCKILDYGKFKYVAQKLSLMHIYETTRRRGITYDVF